MTHYAFKFLGRCISASLLCAALSSVATAGSYDGAFSKTKYTVLTADINGDGRDDVMLLASKQFAMIPLDELTIPIAFPAPGPTFILVSNAAGYYTLVPNPDQASIKNPAWRPSSQKLTFTGPYGPYADAMNITAINGSQASFAIAMSTSTGLLELRTMTPPSGALPDTPYELICP